MEHSQDQRNAFTFDADALQDSARDWLGGRGRLPEGVGLAHPLADTDEGRALVAAVLLTEAHGIREWMDAPCSCGLFYECQGGAQ